MKFLIFGGGGKVSRLFTKQAIQQGHQTISIVRNEDHFPSLKSLGSHPIAFSLESSTLPSLVQLLTTHQPDTIIWSAGAGGKGGKERTRAVDYEAAVKVFEAMETANFRRLVYVGAVDVRSREKGVPEYYTEEDVKMSERMWGAIPDYMQAKLDAELELHSRKSIAFTVIRPGGLTDEPAKGAEIGITRLTKTSRELVAQTILAAATTEGTEGLTIDVMDGDGDVQGQLQKVVDGKIDAWTG